MESSTRTQEISKLYRIHKTVTDMLEDRGFVTEKYTKEEFINDIVKDSPIPRETMTILTFKNEDMKNKIFVFFIEKEKFGKDDLRIKMEQLKAQDVLRAIFVLRGEISVNLSEFGDYHFESFKEEELLVNITQHELVPKHTVISDEDKKILLKRYKAKESQLPKILITDPIARYYGLKKGDVVKIVRTSETAGRYITYRIVG